MMLRRHGIFDTRRAVAEHKNSQDGFLQRWSERKQDSRTAEPLSTLADGAQNTDAEAVSSPAQAPRHELSDADMPPLESLDEHSDFTGFLSPKVSEALQRQALRKLFHLPSFNVTDGLDDYDEDYTRSNVLLEWVSGKLAERKERRNIVSDGDSAPTDPASVTSKTAGHTPEAPVTDEEESNGEESDVTRRTDDARG